LLPGLACYSILTLIGYFYCLLAGLILDHPFPSKINKTINCRLRRLRFAEDRLQVRLRSAGTQKGDLLGINKKPRREFLAPLEVSHDHLLITPPSHFTPQNTKGWVDGLINYGGATIAQILTQAEILSRRILPLERASIFKAKIEDLFLKCCILGDDSKNKEVLYAFENSLSINISSNRFPSPSYSGFSRIVLFALPTS
jgi:hypothetical protein